jgi:nucleoside-diphosphate-sugar epimerase
MERASATRRRPSTIYSLVRACLDGQNVAVRGHQVRRTWTRAEDAAVLWRDLTLADSLEHNVYNVSAGVAYSLGEVLNALQEADPSFRFSHAAEGQEAQVEITPYGQRPALDMTRSREEFHFAPAYTLERGIGSYLAWARQNPELF